MVLTRWVERVGPRRLDVYYRFLLDYYYWLGARAALEDLGVQRGAGTPASTR
jgi:hypothetical protein